MESNKENVPRKNSHTRIPLPVFPLPAIPNYLLNKTAADNEKVRKPLNILSQFHANEACSSSSQIQNGEIDSTKYSFYKMDTKNVTVRAKIYKEPFWEYNVFQDGEVINISDDDADESVQKEGTFGDNGKKKRIEEPLLSVTPSLKFLEHQSVRNIKRSLKRPHSRELQGLSPMASQEDQQGSQVMRTDEKVKRRLQFSEKQEVLKSPDYLAKLYMGINTRQYSEDIFQHLLVVERKPLNFPHCSSATRSSIINWLIKINGPDNPAIVQSACWYLDSILGTYRIYIDKINVIAAACYWIAQKVHGPAVSAITLARRSGYAFSGHKLLGAEKIVMAKLRFPPQPVVPQDFIGYLSWWCDANRNIEIEETATFVCMSGLAVETELCKEFPSVIAAAAVTQALLLLRREEVMSRLTSCPVYQAANKKTLSMSSVVTNLRSAFYNKSASNYGYKCPLEQ